jgi:hypothetical protein
MKIEMNPINKDTVADPQLLFSSILLSFRNKLDLAKDVIYQIEPKAQLTKCSTNPTQPQHIVYIPEWMAHLFQIRVEELLSNSHKSQVNELINRTLLSPFCDLVHELCHLYLAEHIHPLFACSRFNKKYGDYDIAIKDPQFLTQSSTFALAQSSTFALAQSVLDVWVNRIRHHFFPKLTKCDLEEGYNALLTLYNRRAVQAFSDPAMKLSIALHLSECKYFDMPRYSHLEFLLNKQSSLFTKFVRELADVFHSAPNIIATTPLQDALAIYQSSVTKVITLLYQYNFVKTMVTPVIVADPDYGHVWEFFI